MKAEDLKKLRIEYANVALEINEINKNPILQFENWFQEALNAKEPEPNALVLSTINFENKPSARVLLMKGIDANGFTFFTNYESKKGKELEMNPFAAATFLWAGLARQVRIEGKVEKVSAEESDEYFAVRPLGSRLGAWASHQSAVIESREVLEIAENELKKKHEGQEIPRPAHWGGYRLIPTYFEFWQGRENRMHDRLAFTLENNNWKIERLSP